MSKRTLSPHLVLISVFRALHKLRMVAAFPVLQAGTVATLATKEQTDEPRSTDFWMKLLVSCILVLLGGVFAGLTIGLMGLDELHLRVLSVSSDDAVERKNASKVLSLLRKGRHWVLVVLLLGNVIVNESLPIFLDSAIGGGVAAVVISTTLIVIFGVIPQAVCARYGLSIGARCAPLVLGLMYTFAPIAWPIAKLLDYALGADEEHTYKKAELRSFLQFHRQGQEPLRDDEIAILNAVLELNTKSIVKIMTPINDVVTLSADAVLGNTLVDELLASGYSRFPVHEPGNPMAFVGLLLIKKLLAYDPSDKKRVSDFSLSILPEAGVDINCFQTLDYFQTGRSHLLLVSKTPGIAGGALGVVTLEDVIEEIIGEEIVDEFDRYEDNQSKRIARRMGTVKVMKGIVEHIKRRAANHTLVQAGSMPAIAANVSPWFGSQTNEEETPLISRIGSRRPSQNSSPRPSKSSSGRSGSGSAGGLSSGTPTPTQERSRHDLNSSVGVNGDGSGGPSYGATSGGSPRS